MDPVEELAALAAEHGVGCHVDACIGGFVLPFLERLGHDVPPWDFRVDGVTEISADVHKYGYCPKGASVILHRDADWFGHQVFLYDQLAARACTDRPAIAGRPPGRADRDRVGRAQLSRRRRLHRDHARPDGRPPRRCGTGSRRSTASRSSAIRSGPCSSFRSATIDLYAVADVMDDQGWNLNRNTEPRGLHLMLSPAHGAVADQLVADLRDAVRTTASRAASRPDTPERTA